MSLGENIRQYRKQSNLSMKALGKAIGVSEQAISQYELDKRTPNMEILLKISSALKVPVQQLYPDFSVSDLVPKSNDSPQLSYEELINMIETDTINHYKSTNVVNLINECGITTNFYNDSDGVHIKLSYKNLSFTLSQESLDDLLKDIKSAVIKCVLLSEVYNTINTDH